MFVHVCSIMSQHVLIHLCANWGRFQNHGRFHYAQGAMKWDPVMVRDADASIEPVNYRAEHPNNENTVDGRNPKQPPGMYKPCK